MMDQKQMIAWLEECARYFENKDPKGEDVAHFANHMNARNAREIAQNLSRCKCGLVSS